MKRLFPLLALVSAVAFAAEVSPDDAARAATAWVGRGYAMGRLPAGRTVTSVDELEDPATGARLHIAKFEGGGYVVLSADDLVDPVLAFSETGDGVVPDEASPFWTLLRGDIAAREAVAGVVRDTAAPAVKRGTMPKSAAGPTAAQRKWAALLAEDGAHAGTPRPRSMQGVSSVSDVRVEPLLQSRWSQSTRDNTSDGEPCYNYYTPSNFVCGCTATAIAQIMRYWRFPTASVVSHTYPCAVDGSPAFATMMGGVYEWDNMPLVPASGATVAQRQEIGKLCFDVGVTVEMNWTLRNSSSSLYSGVACLPIDFGYASAKAVHYGTGQSYDLEHFKRGVIPNLDARCPVGLGVSGAGGHSVVIDGYGYSGDDFYVHLNMGWAGLDDAWYNPPNLGTSNFAFSVIDGYLFNVFPTNTGSIASGRVLDASLVPVAGAGVVLMRNGETIATTTSDANGIYSFFAPAGDYVVVAAKDSVDGSVSVTLADTTGTYVVTESGRRGWCGDGAGTIGNSYGNDIVLTGLKATPAPVFSPDGCLFYPATNVTIICSDSDATIRYTFDGSDPTETSDIYLGPITLGDTVTIAARAFSSGKNPSPVVRATYTYDAAQGAPQGDYFADPIPISGASGTLVIDDNSAYTVEADEPYHTQHLSDDGFTDICYFQCRTIWYEWTAPGTGTMTFQTSCLGGGYIYPTYIAVYTGDSLSLDNRLAYAIEHDATDYVTSLDLSVEEGATYRIVGVMGYDGSGAFTLEWSGDLAAPLSPYEAWAGDQGLGGPEEITGGVENVFRYVFGKPTEDFSPISSISVDASGRALLGLSPIVTTNGVILKILSTTNLADWSSGAADVHEVSGNTVLIPDTGPSRFFRLKAIVE